MFLVANIDGSPQPFQVTLNSPSSPHPTLSVAPESVCVSRIFLTHENASIGVPRPAPSPVSLCIPFYFFLPICTSTGSSPRQVV